MRYVLALDQGTTSTRAILFDEDLRPVFSAQEEFEQHFPHSGWVEHEADDLWQTSLRTMRGAMEKGGVTAGDVAAIGITNQRETTVIWDRATGKPIHRAIVWQDRRTAEVCEALKEAGHEPMVTERTGLLLDPYFSGTKVKWLLDNVEGAQARAEAGELAFGTIDSWLIWNMTGGKAHVCDATNAARTLLYNIRRGEWDAEICALLDIPMTLLPEVKDCDAEFGSTDVLGGETPILGVAGDQQAATVGQACFEPGMLKSTYGTGCFALLNTGDTLVQSQNRLLGTIAYQFGGKVTYALEGSIFIAGAAVQWLRDGMGMIEDAKETQAMAEAADEGQNVILVPAFTGLGAPHWSPNSRGAIFGLTRNTGPKELARAALQSVGYQTRDLIEAMRNDWDTRALGTVLRVDGGMAFSDWTMQFLADICGAQVDRPEVLETTALGVAWIAGKGAGIYPDAEEFAKGWALDRRFEPAMGKAERSALYQGWSRAVKGTLGY
ncbi:glycerol kinase GlpK [Alphaproteobacteria bacterium KMM 3653]|uniref:Glycerol kinase n=1 Tax=Harenicola maris TaxID=2841044 RepID=A0AAP2CQ12_9RHOB|nr:glycerol kinase GlpK [Harenicola maris]